MQGIYAITNILTDTVYYGQAVNIERRLRRHKNDLNSNKHSNPYLQNSYNKYGLLAFIFTSVQLVENKEILVKKEQEFIDNTYFLGLKSFNLNNAMGSRIGRKMPEEAKQKISKNHSHYWLNKEFSKEHKNKISKNHSHWNKGLKGLQVAWNKGKTLFPVDEIKLQYSKGYTQQEIANKHNTDQGTISRIVHDRRDGGR
jgi:group I intron endonuclease